MKWFWPIVTGHTFFDYWTLVHFAFWFVVGSTFTRGSRLSTLLVCLVLAYFWEAFERYAEQLWPALFLTPEGWINALVSDPLMCVAGLLVAWYGFDHWRF